MGKRLTFDSSTLIDLVKSFETMYSKNSLYDYANYITLSCENSKLMFEMCIILDGASTDSMVRMWETMEGLDNFDPLTVDFTAFKNIVKEIKDTTMTLDVSDKAITIETARMTHHLELSTVKIPAQISNKLDYLVENSAIRAVDFNLLKLYNNMSMIGETLTLNTLYAHLYGIMHTPEFMAATTGFSMAVMRGGVLNESFLFPKHSLKILKLIPKLGAKYYVHDKRIYIQGQGFHCYIGEWADASKYPVDALTRVIDSELTPVNSGVEVLEAMNSCHKFSDVAYVYLGLGYATTKAGTHKVSFEPTPAFGEGRILIHKDVLIGLGKIEHLSASQERSMFKAINEERIFVFLGMRDEDE